MMPTACLDTFFRAGKLRSGESLAPWNQLSRNAPPGAQHCVLALRGRSQGCGRWLPSWCRFDPPSALSPGHWHWEKPAGPTTSAGNGSCKWSTPWANCGASRNKYQQNCDSLTVKNCRRLQKQNSSVYVKCIFKSMSQLSERCV